MNVEDLFWKASVDELKKGFSFDSESESYVCLICGEIYAKGEIYHIGGRLCEAGKAVGLHIAEKHGSMFEFFLKMGKKYNGLTERQKELMTMFYSGYSDKEVVDCDGADSASTVRNHRFALREKYKQAKITVAMTELLEERRERLKTESRGIYEKIKGEELVSIHRTASVLDERFAITQTEKDDVLGRYFDADGNLAIKEIPVRQKRKIIILQHIAKQFEANKKYTEKEINEIISRFYEDIPSIRRYFIEYGFLDRTDDGALYWVKQ